MIACRPQASADRLYKALCAPTALPYSLRYFQGLFQRLNSSYALQMDGVRDWSNKMDRQKKCKPIAHGRRQISTQGVFKEGYAWRPISTEAVSAEVDRNERSDNSCPQPEAQNSSYTSTSHSQIFSTDESVVGVTKLSTVASVNVDESEAIEEKEAISFSYEVKSETGSCDQSDKAFHGIVIEEVLQEHGSDKHQVLTNEVEKHSLSVEVDAPLIRFLRGQGGSMQKQIEGETGVKIIFKSSKKATSVVIEGDDVESVTKASEKITTVLEEAVKSPKLDYSHFVSLPLAIHPALVQKLHHFQNSILGNSSSSLNDDVDMDLHEDTSVETGDDDKQAGSSSAAVKFEVEDKMEHVRVKIDTVDYSRGSKNSSLSDLGIERSIFISPKTFHLTVLMLKLWNKDRIAAASEVLQSISSKVKDALDNRPISIRLKGLTCMRGSPAKARVVYAPVIEVGGEGRLLRACQVIIDAFVESGLVLDKDAHHTLKLHATLMNVRHRKRSTRTGRNDFFDARHIFRVYGSEDWGEYQIPVVHLSQRFKFDESGYYHCCSSIPLPEDMQTE
ncbi:uncharacterized protein [Typha angustifolia]|uniref:uncharacterized protein isoform X1 n=2 Tax=Typha angustifolia TaxID=59011 RepID=UPI003C2B82E0